MTDLCAPVLRAAGPRDIAAVEEVMADAFDPRYGEAWTRNQCLGVLALPGVALWLAELDGCPAGFAMTRQVADEAELLLLAVVRRARRRGVGSALLGAALARCGAEGARRLHLEVRRGNPAVGLYLAQGFAQVGERRSYYRGAGGELHDALSLSRAIS